MKLLEQVLVVARRMRSVDTTIQGYTYWIRHYLTHLARRFGVWKRPEDLFTEDLEIFLNPLVMEKRLSASSRHGIAHIPVRVQNCRR